MLAARGVSLRTACNADAAFERALFETARPDEALFSAWPAADSARFLDEQFRCQTVHYAGVHPDADRMIALAGGEAIGRLILDAAAGNWCIVDIALLPQWRGRGIGACLLQAVQHQARRSGASAVKLTVEMGNPARRLYERLGFIATADEPPHVGMTWRPSADQLKIA